MDIDVNIGGGIDGTVGGDLGALSRQIESAQASGADGVWSTEVNHDPFLPLMLAAARSERLQLGTAVAVAFARSPMITAAAANDLATYSGGRFVLGLGSQIRAHIERRFSMPWSAPVDRMSEYLDALQAIWRSWQTGEKLQFRGEHYRHTLSTPMFRPERSVFGPPPVVLAAVGPRMTRLAARKADGILVHGFTTPRYLNEVTIPAIAEELAAAERRRENFTISYPGLIATADTEEGMTVALDRVRRQIAFYGATPAYRPVLELHGWGDLHTELHRLSREGRWATMTALVEDDVLHAFATVGEPHRVGADIHRRFAGLVDRFTLYTPYPLDEATRAAVVEGIRWRG